MLESKDTQFSLSPEGKILWQQKIGSPLPGEAVASLKKGAHVLQPELEIIENDLTKDADSQKLANRLKHWLNDHIKSILEPLVLLGIEAGQGKDDPVSLIVKKVYDHCGILPRADLEDEIAKLDNDMRVALRAKKIRLGPLLAFMPDLNKPAAVKLKAMLWSIDHDKALPADVPADGIVSVRLEQENPDRAYYQVIGYPVYGGRAVRIDMLDRVVSSIYDNAEKGRFRARHEMAEWLGSTIEDLYKVLEDLGHKKISDPAETKEEAKEDKSEEKIGQTEPSAADATEKEKPAEADEVEAKDKPQIKPELAEFALKRGKAYKKSSQGKGGFKHKKKPDQQNHANKGKKGTKHNKDKKKQQDRGPRVISFEAERKEEDSPFAILQNLEIKNKK